MNSKLRILSGTAHPALSQAIADNLGVPLGSAVVETFPDGETFVQINENIRGRDVFIVQPTCPPANPWPSRLYSTDLSFWRSSGFPPVWALIASSTRSHKGR